MHLWSSHTDHSMECFMFMFMLPFVACFRIQITLTYHFKALVSVSWTKKKKKTATVCHTDMHLQKHHFKLLFAHSLIFYLFASELSLSCQRLFEYSQFTIVSVCIEYVFIYNSWQEPSHHIKRKNLYKQKLNNPETLKIVEEIIYS